MMAIQSSNFKRPISERDGDNLEEQIVNLKKMKSDVTDISKASNGSQGDILGEKMYKAHVKSALDALDNNDSTQIESLASQISLPSTHIESISITNFQIVLNHLTANISKLDSNKTNCLVLSILKYKWLIYKEDAYFFKAYSNFLSVLISSYPKWWNDVANKLISDFVYSKTDQIHDTLKYLLSIIPTSISVLPNILIKHFPHKTSSKKILINYIQNLLTLNTYCSELGFQIWCLVIENCIKIDVELTNEIDDLDEDDVEEIDDEISDDETEEPDDEENEENDQGSDDDDELLDEEEYNVETVQNITKLSSTLDSIMCVLLDYLKDSFTIEKLNNGDGVILFNTLISLFKSHILSTHYTKSVQYLLFHIAQEQPELMDSFLVTLIDIAFNHLETIEKRIKSLQYLSSFIARAKNLSKHQIVFVVSYLLGWLNKYVDERESEINDGKGGMERFKLFYAAFQALLYIFCFRHTVLNKSNNINGNDEDESNQSSHHELNSHQSTVPSEWECGLDSFFQRMIVSKFNPLKYCNETVVLIFARISQQQNVAYCFSIIDHNKRERISGLSQSSSLSATPNANKNNGNFIGKQDFLDLESYFPFDPILLKKTKKIISANFIEWTDIEDDFDSDSNSDDYSDGAIDAIEHVRKFSTNEKSNIEESEDEDDEDEDEDED